MGFWEDLMTDAVLPTSIRTALSITDTGAVFAGRRPEKVPRETAVWVERLPAEQIGSDGFQHVTAFNVSLHVLVRTLQMGSQSGVDQLTTLQSKMRTLVKLYNGVQPLTALTNCFTIKAEEGEIDLEEDDQRMIDGTVDVTFYVIGDGV